MSSKIKDGQNFAFLALRKAKIGNPVTYTRTETAYKPRMKGFLNILDEPSRTLRDEFLANGGVYSKPEHLNTTGWKRLPITNLTP